MTLYLQVNTDVIELTPLAEVEPERLAAIIASAQRASAIALLTKRLAATPALDITGALTAIAKEITLETLVASTAEASDEDVFMQEAVRIARELIQKSLAKEGITITPPTIDSHARALVDASPEIREQARLRLATRSTVSAAALARLDG